MGLGFYAHGLKKLSRVVYSAQTTQPVAAEINISTPNTIRYQTKIMKSCELIYRSNQRTQKKAEINAANAPTPNIGKSATESKARSLYNE